MTSLRVGCVFRPENPPETLPAAARAAEDAGVDELWLWEDCFFHGGLSAAAIALANSTSLVVGIGVLPVPLRNVALTAMEIAMLERTFPGRLRVGIGHGVQDWMAQVGERVGSPLTLLREYTTALTALLNGETVDAAGRYVTLSDVRLDWPPSTPVEVLLAATGPKTLALSGELASGSVLTSGTAPDAVREAVSVIRAAAVPPRPHHVVAYVSCGLDDDRADAEVRGSAEQVADGARQWIDAGVDIIVLQPRVGEDATEFIRAIGTRVAPLLRG
ncbi:LLM class flavin-dependent oxidoreductase [Mycolicibacterium sp. GCM10028919]|uniref:LLM class flavin-dependent oxidoreductase n=1 Tax=Mycolicibacterium sp. GCM10028919 TaxID=3273401 RepID=UPI003606C9B4